MVCNACGKAIADEFKFCPQCGGPVEIRPTVTESSDSAPEPLFRSDAPGPAQRDVSVTGIQAGTVVFGIFAVITLMVSIIKGIVPIFLLEAAGWAGLAWYWQHKKTHSENAKSGIIVLAVLVALGEVVHIAASVNSRSTSPVTESSGTAYPLTPSESPSQLSQAVSPSATPPASDGKVARSVNSKKDLSLETAKGVSGSLAESVYLNDTGECPKSLPSGITAKPLASEELANVVGTKASLDATEAKDSYGIPSDADAWNAHVWLTNKTGSCIVSLVVEFQLSHSGTISNERHSFNLGVSRGDFDDDTIVAPNEEAFAIVPLKIRTSDKSGDVTLLGWQTVGARGFKVERQRQ